MPDLSIIFYIAPEVGLSRIKADESREVNRLDKEKLEFHNKVREGYKKILQDSNRNIVKINAEKAINDVFLEVKQIVKELIYNK